VKLASAQEKTVLSSVPRRIRWQICSLSFVHAIDRTQNNLRRFASRVNSFKTKAMSARLAANKTYTSLQTIFRSK
jgi:hypothetical protein